jgi:hypothetical protein
MADLFPAVVLAGSSVGQGCHDGPQLHRADAQ